MTEELTAEVIVKLDGKDHLKLTTQFDSDELPKPLSASHPSLTGLRDKFTKSGFSVGPIGPYSVTITGPLSTYKAVFDARFEEKETSAGRIWFQSDDPSLHCLDNPQWPEIGGLVIVATGDADICKVNATGLSVGPKPKVPYYYLNAPGDLVQHLNASQVHAEGLDGRDVDLIVVDTGWWAHPWFTVRGIMPEVILAHGAKNPALDEVGHGTMVCASVLSLAPKANVRLVKQADDTAFPAFKQAIALKPQIIQNTWGRIVEKRPIYASEKLVACTVRQAVEQGIIVVFAGGNGKKLFPQQMPEVIAIGGAYVAQSGALSAASYASGYESALFPNRIVPDFCGLVGLRPDGIYIMMPTMPGSIIDRSFAEKPYPYGDGTDKPADGWVVISGTSSGSGQVSGLAAILKQIRGDLKQAQMRNILAQTAQPILSGVSSEGNPAGLPTPNLATGYGIVDSRRAIAAVKELT